MKLGEWETKLKALIPTADIQTDNYGQLVIYTNMKMEDPDSHTSEVVEMTEDDFG